MIKKGTAAWWMIVLLVVFLTGCGVATVTVIEMEMTSNYDDSDPYVNEKLFYVSADSDQIDFEASFRMESESGLLEITDNETDEVIWDKAWKDHADDTFSISLHSLDKEKEYVIRLTCVNHLPNAVSPDFRMNVT